MGSIALGIHVRVGIKHNLWRKKSGRMTSVQQIEQMVRIAKELGRKVATGDEARQILKLGTWYHSLEETLADRGKALAGKSTLNRLELTSEKTDKASRYKKIVARLGSDGQAFGSLET